MPTVEIDQDIHDFLLQRVRGFGESASDVLRRELSLNGTSKPISTEVAPDHELAEALDSSKIKHARGVVGRFLEILAVAHSQNNEEFEFVLAIQGRGRIYFARTKNEIEASGNSTQPRQIPGAPYWVMTNSPTSQKKVMLREVLESLGYSSGAVRAAVRAIGT